MKYYLNVSNWTTRLPKVLEMVQAGDVLNVHPQIAPLVQSELANLGALPIEVEIRDECLTLPTHWDCECQENYIHPKSQVICEVCGAIAEEQPDSRYSEVAVWLQRRNADTLGRIVMNKLQTELLNIAVAILRREGDRGVYDGSQARVFSDAAGEVEKAIKLLDDETELFLSRGHPRVDVEISLDELVSALPESIRNDPGKLKAWVDSTVDQVSDTLSFVCRVAVAAAKE